MVCKKEINIILSKCKQCLSLLLVIGIIACFIFYSATLTGTIEVKEFGIEKSIPADLSPLYLMRMHIETRLRMLAVTIDLKSVFAVYLPRFGTTYPISEVRKVLVLLL